MLGPLSASAGLPAGSLNSESIQGVLIYLEVISELILGAKVRSLVLRAFRPFKDTCEDSWPAREALDPHFPTMPGTEAMSRLP